MTEIREIYLDNSSTTKPFEEVAKYIYDVSMLSYGNPSSKHTKGIEAENLVKQARTRIANSLKVDSKEILFTSGGTESNNTAIIGYLKGNPRLPRHIITSVIEHPSVLEVYKQLEKEGYRVDYIPVDKDGRLDMQALRGFADSETALISIIHTNNESGTIQDIQQISKIRDEKCPNAALHIDAVQGFGKTLIMPAASRIDMLSVSSHKIHGPKGVGALYIKKGLRVKPLMLGGGQESTLRSGTENVPGICGFGLAAEMTFANLAKNLEYVGSLKSRFVEKIRENFEAASINTPQDASPYIINVSFPNLKAEVLLHHLEQKNIFVSTGSACSSRKNHRSHVLLAMGVEPKLIDGAIRFSLSSTNTVEEIDDTITALKEIIPIISIKKR